MKYHIYNRIIFNYNTSYDVDNIKIKDYQHVYTLESEPVDLDILFHMFQHGNDNTPNDYNADSISAGSVIVIEKEDGEKLPYYITFTGYKLIPNFFK